MGNPYGESLLKLYVGRAPHALPRLAVRGVLRDEGRGRGHRDQQVRSQTDNWPANIEDLPIISVLRTGKCTSSSENTAVFHTMPRSISEQSANNPQFWPANCQVDSFSVERGTFCFSDVDRRLSANCPGQDGA